MGGNDGVGETSVFGYPKQISTYLMQSTLSKETVTESDTFFF
jgi:hypothetical protein